MRRFSGSGLTLHGLTCTCSCLTFKNALEDRIKNCRRTQVKYCHLTLMIPEGHSQTLMRTQNAVVSSLSIHFIHLFSCIFQQATLVDIHHIEPRLLAMATAAAHSAGRKKIYLGSLGPLAVAAVPAISAHLYNRQLNPQISSLV